MIPALALALLAAAVPVDPFLKDLAETKKFSLGQPTGIRVAPDGSAVWFLRSPPRSPQLSLHRFDVATGTSALAVSPGELLAGAVETLSPEERARRERQRIQTTGFASFELSEDGRRILLPLSGRLWLHDVVTGRTRPIATGEGAVVAPHLSPDGTRVAFVRDDELHVVDIASGRVRRLTTGAGQGIVHGLAEFVAQEEMSRFDGFWWSPDGRTLAFEESDERGVERLTLTDPAHPEAEPDRLPYPRPGKANAKVRLGLVPSGGGRPVWVRWDTQSFPYLARVVWDVPGTPPVLLVQSRDQRDAELLTVDVRTGSTHRLLALHDDAWLELDDELPVHTRDGRALLLARETDEGRALVAVDDGGRERTVVPASLGFASLVQETPDGLELLVHPHPLTVRRARAFLDGRPPALLDDDRPAERSEVCARDGSVCVVTSSTERSLPISTVLRADGSAVGVLEAVRETPSVRAKVELVEVEGARRYEAALVRPRDFDPARRYPVVMSVYGGPTVNVVRASERAYLHDQWLADHGVVVVSVDNRGTPRRGRAWSRALRGRFGEVPLDDQIDALQALGRRFPELDLAHVGVHGWSFGGYLSALAVLRRPDVFHVAVAGAPVVDWGWYDTHYTERYLGLPDAEPEAYRAASLLTYADDLRRPLLVIHGTGDDNVYFLHALKLAEALVRAGRPFDFLPITGTHMVADPIESAHLHAREAAFLLEGLGVK